MSSGNTQSEIQVDQPIGVEETAPSQSEANQGFTSRELRRNMFFCIMLDTIWLTGWTDFQLALQPLLVYLKASNTTIGLITGASSMALVGTFLSPWISRRFAIKKWYLFATNVPYIGAIGIIGLGIVGSRSLGLSSESLLSFVFWMIIIHMFFTGFVALPHQEYVAACIPMSHRGRLTGLSASLGSAASIGSAAVGGWILLHYQKPMSFGYLCLMTWFICQGGYVLALFAKEKPVPIERIPKPWSKTMFMATWNDKPYVKVMLLFCFASIFIAPIMGFVNIYGFRELKMPAATSAIILMISQIARIATSGPAGWITDRYGPKRILPYWSVGIAAALLPPILMHNAYGVYLSAAINTVFWAIWGTAYNVLLYGLPKPENRSGHYTIQHILQYSSGAIGAIWVGRVMDIVPYRTMFILAAVAALAIIPVIRWIAASLSDDPKAYS